MPTKEGDSKMFQASKYGRWANAQAHLMQLQSRWSEVSGSLAASELQVIESHIDAQRRAVNALFRELVDEAIHGMPNPPTRDILTHPPHSQLQGH